LAALHALENFDICDYRGSIVAMMIMTIIVIHIGDNYLSAIMLSIFGTIN